MHGHQRVTRHIVLVSLNLPNGHIRSAGLICLVLNFYYMFTRESLRHDDANDVIYDTDGACEGRYGCMRGPIWVH